MEPSPESGQVVPAGGVVGAMAGENEEWDAAAERLEAALERIAKLARHAAANGSAGDGPPVDEIAARLDGMIGRIRSVLNAGT